MCQLLLEYQGQKVTANGAFPRETLVNTQHNLTTEPQNLTVSRGTNHCGNILVFRDEISRNNHIESWLVTAFRHFLARAINLASFQDFACSLINSMDWRS